MKKKIKVKYQCQHLTCRMPQCHEGEITLDKDRFDMFCDVNPEPGCFTSPSAVCKIGHTQTFKILSTEDIKETAETIDSKETIEEGKVKKGGVNREPPSSPRPEPPKPMSTHNEQESVVEKILNEVEGLKKEVIKIKQEFDKLEKKVEKLERIKKGTKVSRRES